MKNKFRLFSTAALVFCLVYIVGCTPESSTSSSSVTTTVVSESTAAPSQADSSKSTTTQGESSQMTRGSTSSRTHTQTTKPPVLTKTQFAFSTPGLPGSRSKELLNNPDRGLRLEVYINAADGGWYPANDRSRSAIDHTKDQIAQYASDNPRLAQT